MIDLHSASGAIEEVSVIGIESKADRISVSVILKSLHVQGDSIAGRALSREEK